LQITIGISSTRIKHTRKIQEKTDHGSRS